MLGGIAAPLISIHALLAESDTRGQSASVGVPYFYPRSPCGERRRFRAVQNPQIDISIHALLAESDRISARYTKRVVAFLSTLSLRRATGTLRTVSVTKTFLSTLSLRRATLATWFPYHVRGNFYPRSPCGERPRRESRQQPAGEISIHALLAESDRTANRITKQHFNFYPRSPCGERQPALYQLYDTYAISIHALLAESDSKSAQNSGALLRI